jgi:maleate cis-trans isomerase
VELGKPVVTVNQAMMFSVMKALLPNAAVPNFGRLFDELKR